MLLFVCVCVSPVLSFVLGSVYTENCAARHFPHFAQCQKLCSRFRLLMQKNKLFNYTTHQWTTLEVQTFRNLTPGRINEQTRSEDEQAITFTNTLSTLLHLAAFTSVPPIPVMELRFINKTTKKEVARSSPSCRQYRHMFAP